MKYMKLYVIVYSALVLVLCQSCSGIGIGKTIWHICLIFIVMFMFPLIMIIQNALLPGVFRFFQPHESAAPAHSTGSALQGPITHMLNCNCVCNSISITGAKYVLKINHVFNCVMGSNALHSGSCMTEHQGCSPGRCVTELARVW